MAINWGGFVKGASDYGLERLKEERALKMEQQLQELKDKYKQAEELRAHKREQKKVAGTRQSASDPLMVEDVNIEGEVLRTRARSAADIEAEEQNRRKFDADLSNIESQIQHRKDSIGVERDRNAIMRARNTSGIEGAAVEAGEQDSDEAVVNRLARQLVNNWASVADVRPDSPASINNMGKIGMLAEQVAWSAVRAGNPDLAQSMFNRAMATGSGFASSNPLDIR